MKLFRAIGAGIGITVSFFYLGCGSIQVAEASHSNGTSTLSFATKQLPSAIVGTPYVAVLEASGGTAGYTWSLAGGQLPAGVSLAPTTGILSGTPAASGNFSISLAVSDSSNPVQVKSSALTITVAPPPLIIAASTLAPAAVGTPYSQTLQTTGGISPYSWSVTSGSLPAGLSLASVSGIISGTPTTGGTVKFTATVRDNEHPAQSSSTATSITVAAIPLKIMTVALASATSGVAYSQSLQVGGGTPTYTWSITSGNLPAGLSLAPTGIISGTPTTNAIATFTASVTDHSSPVQTATSVPFTIAVGSTPLNISTPTLGSGTVGSTYSQSLKATGGSAPYSWSITSGSLPSGLALTSSTGAISGVPNTSGTSTFTATVVDSGSPAQTLSVSARILVAPTPVSIINSALPSVTVGNSYSATLQATGGTAPYNWSIASGNLPAGLTLTAAGTISGTPTTSGKFNFTATVIDSSSPVQTASATKNLTISATTLTVVPPVLPNVTIGTAYSKTLTATGGVGPYVWSITSGRLPQGLNLAASAGTISGVPTASGISNFTATVTDSGSPTQSAPAVAAIVVAPTLLAITSSSLTSTTVGASYQQSMRASGGSAPYNWTVTSGTLPTGLSLSQSSGTISGTATASGTFTFTATVTDSSSPAQLTSATNTISVTPTLAPPAVSSPLVLSIVTSSLPSLSVGASYTQTLQASGGTSPYTWQLASGQLPTGLSLSPSGTISGTPSSSTASTFTVSVTDSGSPAQTQSAGLSIGSATSPLAISSSVLLPSTNGTSYSQSLSASGGTPAYTWSISAGSLPPGFTLTATKGVISGTPSVNGTWTFTVTVSDNSSPVQSQSALTSIAISPTQLKLSTPQFATATVGAAYTQALQATGGTASYTWSIASGKLPGGLNLNASTGSISGIPATSGGSSFTVSVSDSGTPAQVVSSTASITVSTPQAGTTWYIRSDGGTRFSPSGGGNTTYGMCNGKSDVPYPGLTSATWLAKTYYAAGTVIADSQGYYETAATSGTSGTYTWYWPSWGGATTNDGTVTWTRGAAYPQNQNCAFNDFRFLYDDQRYDPVSAGWVIAGGDTVVVRGCYNVDENGDGKTYCRVGGSPPNHPDYWCIGGSLTSCSAPQLPPGTQSQPTIIEGQCGLAGNCSSGNATNLANLTQIYGGNGNGAVLNLGGANYASVIGIEITDHTQCTNSGVGAIGAPYWPAHCTPGVDDWVSNGVVTNASTTNITFQDVNIHGVAKAGLAGPIGAGITMTRVAVNFNAFAGWNFDDGLDTPDGPHATINASFVDMIGNGCNEEYPIVHTQFSALACNDLYSGSFGDSWSGQDTNMDTFVCDHCRMLYNTKDGFIGPHTFIGNLSITNSESIGNMGQDWKWGAHNVLFQNNLTIGNCFAMAGQLPGASINFAAQAGLPVNGAYLSDFCRASGDVFSFYSDPGGAMNFLNNTVVSYQAVIFDENTCGTGVGKCTSDVLTYKNNIFLSYALPNGYNPSIQTSYVGNAQASALFYPSDVYTRVTANNIEYGLKPGTAYDICGVNGIICADPKLINEPLQGAITPESNLYNFNFYPSAASPAISAGAPVGLTSDYYGNTRPVVPTIGAVEPQ